jgi:hypothetical protein
MKLANFKYPSILYVFGACVLLVASFFFLGFFGELFNGPKGIHFMRQSDSLSFASQYYNHGFDFFNPKLYNLKNFEGRAACEFPITYYITALLYTVFGKSPLILKLVHLIIIYIGIYHVFLLTKLYIKSIFTSVLISLFLFTSTVFNYYSFNYLPDSAALGFTFVGLYYYFKYCKQAKLKSLIWSISLLGLASLIKVTYAIYPIAIFSLAMISLIIKKDCFTKVQIKKTLILVSISLGIVCLWNLYIIQYNSLYDSNSFVTYALPIWELSKDDIIEVFDIMINHWNSEYFAHTSMAVIAFLIVFQLIFYKKSNRILLYFSGISLIGCICYFLLFYSQFKDHDYYILVLYPFITLILVNGMKIALEFNYFPKLNIPKIAPILLLLIVTYGINYSRQQLEARFQLPPDKLSLTAIKIQEKLKKIEALNIPDKAKFIIAPEYSQNGSLLLLDKEGWCFENTSDLSNEKILEFKNKGAQYILTYTANSELKASGNIIFSEDGLIIYKME